ncbi:RNA/RNP complex-1-interacting phosphatase homolog [Octopus sinensis]|uniref:RNA/RNP complex-1-interacting phosphatase homolog n=1 Tax=Octopus sinensis TaxID=2607531 RepID=A0A6P7T5I2_9MOLL|nr:RNA/RNP complex-1-interacting phosphatase homolog [Octopus sinensis]
MPGIPDRWEIYSKIGKIIEGTRFLACKTPLKSNLTVSLADEMRFTPNDLIEAVPQVGLVVDFTNTGRYYNPNDFKCKEGIDYMKIYTEGRVIPKRSVISSFFKTVDAFLKDNSKKNKIIVAHCTHGLNRTGYFICRYMITKMNFPPQVAIDEFDKARGHKMERENYITDLLRLVPRKFDFSLSNSKSKESSQLPLPNSKIKKQKSKKRQQQDGDNFSNNALHSQDVPNYSHQTAPYQQEPYLQLPYQQRPYQQRPYQQNCYRYNPYKYAPHEQKPYFSNLRRQFGMYDFDEQPSQQGYQGHKEPHHRRFSHKDRRQKKNDY